MGGFKADHLGDIFPEEHAPPLGTPLEVGEAQELLARQRFGEPGLHHLLNLRDRGALLNGWKIAGPPPVAVDLGEELLELSEFGPLDADLCLHLRGVEQRKDDLGNIVGRIGGEPRVGRLCRGGGRLCNRSSRRDEGGDERGRDDEPAEEAEGKRAHAQATPGGRRAGFRRATGAARGSP